MKKYREIDANPFKIDRFDEDLEQKLFKERDYFRVEMDTKAAEEFDDEMDLVKMQRVLRKHKQQQLNLKSEIEQQHDLLLKRSKTIFKILNAAIKKLLEDDKKKKPKKKGKKG